MPTYEYLCKTCNLRFDAVQSFADDAYTTCDQAPITCPRGGGGELRKVFGAVGITFKGSGFYKNDSRGSTSSTAPATGDSSAGTAKPESGGSSVSTDTGSPSSTPSSSSDSSGSSSDSSGSSAGHSHGHSHGAGTHTH